MTPASEALAFRIWVLCQPRGWGMTLVDCAEELGENVNRVRAVAQHKGWADRFKAISDWRFSPHLRAVPGGYAEMRETINDLVGPHQREAAE